MAICEGCGAKYKMNWVRIPTCKRCRIEGIPAHKLTPIPYLRSTSMKLMWLSYVNKETAEALGVVIVPVFDDELLASHKRLEEIHPHMEPGSDAVYAAVKKARDLNVVPEPPGTLSVGAEEVDPAKVAVELIGRFITRAELIERGLLQNHPPAS